MLTDEEEGWDDQCQQACEADDDVRMQQLLSDFTDELKQRIYLPKALRYALENRAVKVLRVALSAGADVSDVRAEELVRELEASKAEFDTSIVGLLCEHGWDINTRTHTEEPLLWFVSGNEELSQWCLDRGAAVTFLPIHKNDGLTTLYCLQLLESAVSRKASLAQFKKLKALGAPVTKRCLHYAAHQASAPLQSVESANQRMELVRYLMEEERINANASDNPEPDPGVGKRAWGPPLWYCTAARGHTLQVVRFLLEHGAIPFDTVILKAQRMKYDTSEFLATVKPYVPPEYWHLVGKTEELPV